MKKIIYTTIILFLLILLLTACKNNSKSSENRDLIPIEYYSNKEDVETEDPKLYFEYNDIDYYTIGIKGISIVYKDIKLERDLKDALENEETTIINLERRSNSKKEINNSTIYYYDTFYYVSCNSKGYFINKDKDDIIETICD